SQGEDGIRDFHVTGVQTCALPISSEVLTPAARPFLTMISCTVSCQKSIFSLPSNCRRHASANLIRSFWVLGLHIAGPLDRLSIRSEERRVGKESVDRGEPETA